MFLPYACLKSFVFLNYLTFLDSGDMQPTERKTIYWNVALLYCWVSSIRYSVLFFAPLNNYKTWGNTPWLLMTTTPILNFVLCSILLLRVCNFLEIINYNRLVWCMFINKLCTNIISYLYVYRDILPTQGKVDLINADITTFNTKLWENLRILTDTQIELALSPPVLHWSRILDNWLQNYK